MTNLPELEDERSSGPIRRVRGDAGNALIRRMLEDPSSSEVELTVPPTWGQQFWPGPYPLDERQLTELGLMLMELGGAQSQQAAQDTQGAVDPVSPTAARLRDPLPSELRTGEGPEDKSPAASSSPSLASKLAFGGTVAGIAGLAFANLHKVNAFADKEEHRLPSWARYSGGGDPATWVHHSTVTVAATLGGAMLGKITGVGAERGAKYAGMAAVLFYLGRELHEHVGQSHPRQAFVDHRQFEHGIHVGWVIDGTMDVTLPYLAYRQLCNLIKR